MKKLAIGDIITASCSRNGCSTQHKCKIYQLTENLLAGTIDLETGECLILEIGAGLIINQNLSFEEILLLLKAGRRFSFNYPKYGYKCWLKMTEAETLLLNKRADCANDAWIDADQERPSIYLKSKFSEE